MKEEINSTTIVPSNNQKYYDYYTIQSGDSLYGIARMYNMNPELLAALNGLNMDEYIYPNQQILVPKSGFSYYITKEGDTLDLVAGMFKIFPEDLISKNQVIYLSEGQVLVNSR